MKKKFQKICVRGCTALFGHQVQNNFFALIKKIFLQTLVEIIFRYHKNFFCVEFISEGIFGKYSKMKVLVLNFGTPSTNFFFALIKKIFLQTLVEIILDIINIFFRVLGPPGAPYEQNDFFYI